MPHFAYPWALTALAVLPVTALLEWRWRRWRRQRLTAYADSPMLPRLLPAGRGRPAMTPWLAWNLAVVCLIVAAARPQGPPDIKPLTRQPVLNVFFVVDVSMSMRAEDASPSRLHVAQQTVDAILSTLPQARAGLIVFAGTARVVCPATYDHEALRTALGRASAGMLSEGGSRPAPAVHAALEKLDRLDGEGRAVVLLTDGETHDSSGLPEMGQHAASRGTPVVAIGIGTLEGGVIPMGKDFWGQKQVRRHRGETVRTRLVSLDLRKAATFSGGAYFDALANPSTPRDAARALRQWTREAVRKQAVRVRHEYFGLFLLAGILVLWLSAGLPEIVRESRPAPPQDPKTPHGVSREAL